jgi:hypothetical protein
MLDLQTISDRIEIDDLITTYTRAIDTGNWDLLDEVFTPDAHVDYTATGGTKGTYPEMKQWLADTLPMFSARQHFVCQKEVTLHGDEAEVRAYLLNPMILPQADGSSFHMDIGAYYLHKLIRTEAGWRSRELSEEFVWDRKP